MAKEKKIIPAIFSWRGRGRWVAVLFAIRLHVALSAGLDMPMLTRAILPHVAAARLCN